jgi:FSR family fosmidomycin resistance protein-like MFS transporter
MRKFNLKILILLSLAHMITDIYQGALPAILPFIKERLSLSYAMTGMILLTSNFTSSLIQPLFGFISDKGKLTWLLPVGCLAAGLGLSFLSMPSSYWAILALVVLSGFGIASYHPEGYKTASFFTGEKRVTGMSVFSVGGNLGFALGPILAVYLINKWGMERLPFLVMIAFVFVALLMFYWKEISAPVPILRRAETHSDRHYPKGTYLSLFLVIAVVMMRASIQLGLMSYIPFYYINYLKGDPLYAGKLIFVFLLGGAIGTLGGAPLADRWGHKRYLVLSMLASSLIFPLIYVVEGSRLFLALGVLGMILVSTFSVTIVMAQHLLPRHLGIASGLMVGFAIGTGGLFVTLLGVIADHFGVPVALQSIMILPVIGLFFSAVLKYPVDKVS